MSEAGHKNRHINGQLCRDLSSEQSLPDYIDVTSKKLIAAPEGIFLGKNHTHIFQKNRDETVPVPPDTWGTFSTPFQESLLAPDSLLLSDWEDLPSIARLGRASLTIRPHQQQLCLRALTSVFRKVQSEVESAEEHQASDVTYKKAALVWTFLLVPQRDDASSGINQAFKRRCEAVLEDNWSLFTAENYSGRRPPPRNSPATTDFEQRWKSCSRFLRCAEYGKAYEHLVSTSAPVEPSPEVKEYLASKHPARAFPIDEAAVQETLGRSHLAQEDPLPAIECTADDVLRAIYRSRRGTKCGVDGCGIEVLRALLRRSSKNESMHAEIDAFLDSLAFFVRHTIVQPQHAPRAITKFLSSSELIALKQGPKLRPIAMANTLHKIGAKILDKYFHRAKLEALFGDVQFGCGTSNGADKIIHLTRVGLELYPELDTSASDKSNAFQRIPRAQVMAVLCKHFPNLAYPVFRDLSEDSQAVYVGFEGEATVILKREGVPQGGVLSPKLYNLAVAEENKRHNEISRASEGGFTVAYFDDKFDRSSMDHIAQILRLQTAPDSLEQLNLDKHELLLGRRADRAEALSDRLKYSQEFGIPQQQILLHPDNVSDDQLLEAQRSYGRVTLGVPVGEPAFVDSWLADFMDSLERELEVLLRSNDVQAVLQFSRYIVINKINHLLRGLPPSQSQPLRARVTAMQRKLWEKICGLRPGGGHGCDVSFSIAQLSLRPGPW